MSVSVSIYYHLAAISPISTFLNNFIYYYTPLDSCTYYGQGARDVATLFPVLPGNPLNVRKYGRGSNWRSQCALSVCMHVQTTRRFLTVPSILLPFRCTHRTTVLTVPLYRTVNVNFFLAPTVYHTIPDEMHSVACS